MHRHVRGTQRILCALTTLLLAVGCAPTTTKSPEAPASTGPVVAHGVGDGRYLVLEALPSTAAARLLPADARYHVVLGIDKELALVVVGSDQRILGRLHVAAEDRPHATVGMRVDYEDFRGRAARVEAWSIAGSIDGQARVGKRASRFRVRLGADGSLAGERWSIAHGDAARADLLELRRARAIGADLGVLAEQLSSTGAFANYERCELGELLALAELGLELSVRAWVGEGRARLPTVEAFAPSERLCAL